MKNGAKALQFYVAKPLLNFHSSFSPYLWPCDQSAMILCSVTTSNGTREGKKQRQQHNLCVISGHHFWAPMQGKFVKTWTLSDLWYGSWWVVWRQTVWWLIISLSKQKNSSRTAVVSWLREHSLVSTEVSPFYYINWVMTGNRIDSEAAVETNYST